MVKKIIKHPLFKGSSIIIGANLVVSGLSYFYHLVTGRLLSPAQYGLLESLIALLYFLVVFAQSFNFTVINALSRASPQHVAGIIAYLQRQALWLSLVLWVGLLVVSPFITKFLQLPNWQTYLVFSLYAWFTFLPMLYLASLQARLKFVSYAVLAVGQNVFKLGGAWVLVGWLGAGTLGAFGAILWQGIVGIILGLIIVKKIFPLKNSPPPPIKIGSYLRLSLLTNIALTSVYSSDILLVKHYFDSHQVGIYSAGSVLSKIIFFGASAILMVAFPLFSKHQPNSKKLRHILALSGLYIVLVCAGGIAVFGLAPSLVVRLLYGAGYAQTSQLLLPLAIFISLASFLNLLVQFLLALGQKQALGLAGLAAVGQIILIVWRHQSLSVIIYNSIIALSLILLLGGWLVYTRLNNND